MKIAIISDTYYPFVKGGADKRYYEIARYLVERGHEVHVFTLRWWGDGKVTVRDGVVLHGVCRPRPLYIQGRRSITEALAFSLSLPWALMGKRFDVLECNIFPYMHCYSAKAISLLRGAGLIIGWWECWGDYWHDYMGKLGFLGAMVEKGAKNLADRIIVETECNRNTLISWGVGADKIVKIPSGAHFDRIQKIPKAGDLLDIVAVGRLIRAKGMHTLIGSLPYLKESLGPLRVGIVGDGPERANLEALTQELGVEEQVKFYGFVESEEEVIALMKAAKVFVYAAVPEGGWALTTVEANACGLPIVSVRQGALGINEAVIDGYNGLLAEEQQPQLLAQKIASVLADDGLRGRLSRNALESAQRYDWPNQARQIEEVYLAVAEARQGGTP